MVRCVGVLRTAFKEANSSLVSGTLCRDNDFNSGRNFGMQPSMSGACHNQPIQIRQYKLAARIIGFSVTRRVAARQPLSVGDWWP